VAELESRSADSTHEIKTQDKLRTVLRTLLAAIQTEEVAGKQARELSDDEVIKVLARESRKRVEAVGEVAAEEHAEARRSKPSRSGAASSGPKFEDCA